MPRRPRMPPQAEARTRLPERQMPMPPARVDRMELPQPLRTAQRHRRPTRRQLLMARRQLPLRMPPPLAEQKLAEQRALPATPQRAAQPVGLQPLERADRIPARPQVALALLTRVARPLVERKPGPLAEPKGLPRRLRTDGAQAKLPPEPKSLPRRMEPRWPSGPMVTLRLCTTRSATWMFIMD